ncbi:MAG: hypothetical protein COU30_02255 [Candidatus Magasanikbacteria bacterium CG10_big_fil_rev_8_21_14_0_10_38_6]|uniref:Acylneuraminate cytidylyltransferase family protein n=1 Tax=Candidatus Magasanikbacteria bacterium CG10_big_fil_rev_8_21_14_0_10_38_6 TaxID=1974647 RepID=A0A2M6P1N9_9BACT|nr:MAG: hypothetical protein COU30_02255 [Candidatus Magasanikbacteria bacterium CG10_big_fil_rev_8_21_14_0_10_38_6]
MLLTKKERDDFMIRVIMSVVCIYSLFMKKILGLITARGGSKRLPRKNIKEFLGKPLLVWSIDVGKQSNVFDHFILSTDDEEIASIGKAHGVDVPFIRPAELATDMATSLDVVIHAVNWMRENRKYYADWIILLEPSCPGRQSFHIQEVKQIIEERDDIDSLVGISRVPGRMSYLKQLENIGDEIVMPVVKSECTNFKRNQDLPITYYVNSAIYAFRVNNLLEGSLWGKRRYGYEMDTVYSQDIDSKDDWIVAEARMKHLLEQ